MKKIYTKKRKIYREKSKEARLSEKIRNLQQVSEKERIELADHLCSSAAKSRKKSFCYFSNFILENIENDSAKVRDVIIRATRGLVAFSPKNLKEERRALCSFIDELIFLMEKHYKDEYDSSLDISNLPPSVYKSLEVLLNNVLFSQKNIRDIYKNYLSKKDVPRWFDCTWKRNYCGWKSCPICRKGQKNIVYLHQEAIFRTLREEEINSIKKKPTNFKKDPLYLETKEWCDDLFEVAGEAKHYNDFWIFTIPAADLFWYSNLLVSKCQYQLFNRFYINEGCRGVDYKYTKYVIDSCIRILEESLMKTIELDPEQGEELKDLLFRINLLKDKLRKI